MIKWPWPFELEFQGYLKVVFITNVMYLLSTLPGSDHIIAEYRPYNMIQSLIPSIWRLWPFWPVTLTLKMKTKIGRNQFWNLRIKTNVFCIYKPWLTKRGHGSSINLLFTPNFFGAYGTNFHFSSNRQRGWTGAVDKPSDFGPRGPWFEPRPGAVRFCFGLEQVTFTPC